MLKPIIYPYSMASKSSRDLARALHTIRVFPDRHYKPKHNHLIINWGNSQHPDWYIRGNTSQWLNYPYYVSISCNKLKSFIELDNQGINCPSFTVDKAHSLLWSEEGHKVFCRKTLTGHSGRGIVIADAADNLVDAPLYTKAVRKDKEYRVHVFNGQIIDYQQKKRRNGFEGGIDGIRNHANGWVFARQDVILPDDVAEQSIKAVKALGLDFGAVDVCTERDTNRAVVFEVNTAPGIENTTLYKYMEAISSCL